MPLFACTECNTIENTALSGFWTSQWKAHKADEKHKPLCSQCDPHVRKWHGKFPRQDATEAGYVTCPKLGEPHITSPTTS